MLNKEYLIKNIIFADLNKFLSGEYDKYLESRALYNVTEKS
ncbi:MAG: hypothetical protein ACI4VL_05795 [Bacilli bacterium]